jgi:hypothetical protein
MELSINGREHNARCSELLFHVAGLVNVVTMLVDGFVQFRIVYVKLGGGNADDSPWMYMLVLVSSAFLLQTKKAYGRMHGRWYITQPLKAS